MHADREIELARPDLILLDWMLPGVSGLEFARRLRRCDSTRTIPIIMLTAKGEEGDKLNGFEAGADDYVVKTVLGQGAGGPDLRGAEADHRRRR